MAILMRGGVYDDFDQNKLLPREFAVVLSNDTSTRDGKAIYICFGPGKVKRISTFEDMRDDMENAGAEVFEQYDAAFREILAQVQALAAQTEQYKDAVNSIRNDIVNTYMPQIQAAATHAAAAKNSADSAADSAKLSESWAVGGTGTRMGEDTDNSKHYSKQAADLVEEAKQIIAASSSGALIPIDTRRFEDLPITSTTGYMYNISNDFVTDDRFVDGTGRFYGAGNNVYWTADGKWDVLAGIQAAEDFVGTEEEMNAKLEAGELRDGITAYVDGVFNYQPGGDPVGGGLLPGGTIAFEEIPESPRTGYVYSLSNDFVTDERFEVGAGVHYSSGTSIYWNKSGKLSVLSGIKPASFSGTRAELDGSMNGLPVGTVAFLTGEEGVTIGRIEVVDGVKQFVGYPLSGGGSAEASGFQVGNVQELTLKEGSDCLTLNWKDPDDVLFNGETIAEWAGTKVVRKEGGSPKSIDDGVIIADGTVKDQYAVDGLRDSDVLEDVKYNYALFPYTKKNIYTMSDVNRISGKISAYDPVLENNTWAQIKSASNTGIAHDLWSVGDEKDGYVIVGFNHDDLADGSGKAGITFAVSNPDITQAGGWAPLGGTGFIYYKNSAVNTSYLVNILNSLPDELTSCIKTVEKQTIATMSTSFAVTYEILQCDLFLFSAHEITGLSSLNGKLIKEGTFYEDFPKILGEGVAYWTRSIFPLATTSGTTKTYRSVTQAMANGNLMYGERTRSLCYRYGFCI